MGKQRKKTIVAGPLVYEAIYPMPNPRDSRAVRQGKKNLTSAAQQRMNQKYQWQKLELVTACNFRPGDIVLTLTFDDAHLPDSRAKVMGCVVWVHPQGRFYLAEFQLPGGVIRECFQEVGP